MTSTNLLPVVIYSKRGENAHGDKLEHADGWEEHQGSICIFNSLHSYPGKLLTVLYTFAICDQYR